MKNNNINCTAYSNGVNSPLEYLNITTPAEFKVVMELLCHYDEALRQVDDHIGDPLLSLYDLGSTSTLTEVLFMERCLRLLKKGGRMGMVLPEGVLNNKKLASVREYFEGKAKLILICSIPQDVFMAAGATVKPSLVFMRKFTSEEEAEYARCTQAAIDEVTALHKSEIDMLNTTISDCEDKTVSLKNDLKIARDKLKQSKKNKKDTSTDEIQIEKIKQIQKDNNTAKKAAENALEALKSQIENEAKPIIKKKFDYDIPIAKIDDAGITTTGATSEGNKLPALVKEYKDYSLSNNLWRILDIKYNYQLDENGFYHSFIEDKEVRKL